MAGLGEKKWRERFFFEPATTARTIRVTLEAARVLRGWRVANLGELCYAGGTVPKSVHKLSQRVSRRYNAATVVVEDSARRRITQFSNYLVPRG